jgi:hypothetical protein
MRALWCRVFVLQVASIAKGRIEFDYTPTANMACHATGAAFCGGIADAA